MRIVHTYKIKTLTLIKNSQFIPASFQHPPNHNLTEMYGDVRDFFSFLFAINEELLN